VLSESRTTGVHHRRDGVNDQFGGGEIGWRFAEPQRRDLEQHEEMVPKDRLGGRGAQVRDLVGFVELGLARWIAHANQRSVSRVRSKDWGHVETVHDDILQAGNGAEGRPVVDRDGRLITWLSSSASEVGSANVHLATSVRPGSRELCASLAVATPQWCRVEQGESYRNSAWRPPRQ